MYGQEDEIYRNEGRTHGHAGPSYNVDILILKSDGAYDLIHQKFDSKKMKNNNVFYDLSSYAGSWEKKKDTLYLLNDDGGKKQKFLILKNNKIALLIDDIGISPAHWKKLKQ